MLDGTIYKGIPSIPNYYCFQAIEIRKIVFMAKEFSKMRPLFTLGISRGTIRMGMVLRHLKVLSL